MNNELKLIAKILQDNKIQINTLNIQLKSILYDITDASHKESKSKPPQIQWMKTNEIENIKVLLEEKEHKINILEETQSKNEKTISLMEKK